MKNSLITLLILLLALPAFTPWLPHGAVHALHDHQAAHHGTEKRHNHSHSHSSELEEHDNRPHNEQASHHPVHLDAVIYFTEYLHVDLQSHTQNALKTPLLETRDIDYTLAAVSTPMQRYELAFVQSPAPPETLRLRPDKTPPYLSTQRLRI